MRARKPTGGWSPRIPSFGAEGTRKQDRTNPVDAHAESSRDGGSIPPASISKSSFHKWLWVAGGIFPLAQIRALPQVASMSVVLTPVWTRRDNSRTFGCPHGAPMLRNRSPPRSVRRPIRHSARRVRTEATCMLTCMRDRTELPTTEVTIASAGLQTAGQLGPVVRARHRQSEAEAVTLPVPDGMGVLVLRRRTRRSVEAAARRPSPSKYLVLAASLVRMGPQRRSSGPERTRRVATFGTSKRVPRGQAAG